MNTELPHVVIIGGGFGGLYAARALRRAPVNVTLIDKHNHHLFQPLLYQVATAGLTAPHIAAPLRKILRRQRNAAVLMAEAVAVDRRTRRVVLSDGELGYDYLIIATGVESSYFGHDDWAEYAPGLKSLADAMECRRRILLAFEAAERESDPERRRALLTFVVIGAGPTGVEMAGAVAEISRHTLPAEFRAIDPAQARIILIEGASRVLPTFDERLSAKAQVQLGELGVEVRTGSVVTRIDSNGVDIGEERIAARTVIWGAGVAPRGLAESLGVPRDRAGRVVVDSTLALAGDTRVFVVGDVAAITDTHGRTVPGVAPAAIQAGHHAARNIIRAVRGQTLAAFRFRDRGMLATIGRSAGVGQIGRWTLSGFIAWFAWLAVHIFFLIGFRNRFVVLFEWAWAYWTYQRTARVVTGGVGVTEPSPPRSPASW
jgi:NADH dehydrogenase